MEHHALIENYDSAIALSDTELNCATSLDAIGYEEKETHAQRSNRASWLLLHLRNFLSHWYIILPSFVHKSFDGSRTSTRPARILRRTAALDGLRGLAAFLVMNFHFFGNWRDPNTGWAPGRSLTDFPILRLWSGSGPGMVAIFFVISGYVLSCKSLKLTRKRQLTELLNVVSSSMFRRGLRLFLPTIAATLIFAILIRIRWFDMARAYRDPHVWPEASVWLEVRHAYRNIRIVTGAWTWEMSFPDYDPNLCKVLR